MREKLVPLVSAAVVVLLQVVVAPVIAIYSVCLLYTSRCV